MLINIKNIIKMQTDLDKLVFQNNQTNYNKTHFFRKLAILVEIGEFSNELKIFKFWSKNRKIDTTKVLDELVDILHFLLSSLIAAKSTIVKIQVTIPKKGKPEQYNKELTKKIIKFFNQIVCAANNPTEISKAISQLINIGLTIGFNWKTIENAYIKKNFVNIERQKNNY